MSHPTDRLRQRWSRFARASSTAVLLTWLPPTATAQPGPAEPLALPQQPAAVQAVQIPVYTVGDCIAIAHQRQPAIAAARASLTAKVAARDGISQPRLSFALARDIDQRRQQAARGVQAAAAEVTQTEWETTYAVTRTYFTAIYARLQYDAAAEILTKLTLDRADLQRILDSPDAPREYNAAMLDRLDIAINLARARQLEGEQGVKRALAALREAMGMGLDCSSFQLADLTLPEPAVVPDKCEVINLALARRGEMMQALVFAGVTKLEVDAQGRHWFRPIVRTFASASDIHSQPVPAGEANGVYRPGAVGPEMPSNLAGPKRARVEQAEAYSNRADAVVAKTRELIALEAEDAFLRWEEANRKIGFTREATTKARRYIDLLERDIKAGARIKPEEMTTNRVLATQASVAFNEALYQQILALANLERVTGGGFLAGFGAYPNVQSQPQARNGNTNT
jgi:outer membrane protein TolC